MVSELKEGEVFVAGTNIRGEHLGGAAKQANKHFGLVWGFGEGLCEDVYAFPTLDENMQQYSHLEMLSILQTFLRCVRAHPELTFLLTPVGTGIAGYPREYIESLFTNLPINVRKVGWDLRRQYDN